MGKKYECLAKALCDFLKEVEEGKKWHIKTIGPVTTTEEYKSSSDSFGSGVPMYEFSTSKYCDERELKAILHCQNEEDFRNEIELNVAQRHKDPWKNYKEVERNHESQLWKNADQKVLSLYQESLKGNSRKTRVDSKKYTFHPRIGESLLSYLRYLRWFIDSTKSTNYENRLARGVFGELKEALFRGINFSEKEKRAFMLSWSMISLRDRIYTPLKLNPSRYPVGRDSCRRFILLGIKKFTDTLNPFYAETVLYIWIAQAAARKRRRMITTEDVLKICPQHLVVAEMYDKVRVREVKVKLDKKKIFPIPFQLRDFLKIYADNRRPESPILTLERSSLENYLRELADELGETTSPVTPETFLEEASLSEHRYVPPVSEGSYQATEQEIKEGV